GGPPGGGPRAGNNSGGATMQAQIRQRMAERFQQDFAAFRSSLDTDQQKRWDSELKALLGAKRAPLYKLVAGKPQAVMVRIGASDGSATEVAGDIKPGDLIVTGERAKE
ncbi:MAG TPA: efflux RND transporter periplasmic adaptor subunit, partial [Pseudoxanthomonas sp.]|nr:efflux RND transporter periplasmic adaptor subunit [Pseudoxanthomonas sp.]